MRLLVPSADDYRAMLHAAATMTRLNAEELAPQLASTPVLMLDARFDKLIPPGQSERLYKALGYPERWIYPLGHSILFYNLPSQVGKVRGHGRNLVVVSRVLVSSFALMVIREILESPAVG